MNQAIPSTESILKTPDSLNPSDSHSYYNEPLHSPQHSLKTKNLITQFFFLLFAGIMKISVTSFTKGFNENYNNSNTCNQKYHVGFHIKSFSI